ncbi:MAG TPA: hypothetical protein VFC86_05380 [Planctomycetota bacterium]|nr:hypothetical protein [Planctomycetota bacterium]
MKTTRRLILSVAAMLVLPGCFKLKETWVIAPDGSGKLEFSFAWHPELLAKLKGFGVESDSLKEKMEKLESLSKIPELKDGIVAMTRPTIKVIDGWKTLSFVAYFDDVNKVAFPPGGKDVGTSLTFALRREGEGYALEIRDQMAPVSGAPRAIERLEAIQEAQAKKVWAVFEDLAQGLDLTRSIRMPGAVTSVEGYGAKEGRLATNHFKELSSLKDLTYVLRQLLPASRKIACGAPDFTEAERASWKKELQDAKDAWPKIEAEMKAEAEKKKD